MRHLALRFSVAAGLIAGILTSATAVAGESSCEKIKAAEEKVAAVLAKWKEGSASDEAVCPKKQAKLAADFQKVAGSCPVGSRVAGTLRLVSSSLNAALEASRACRDSCSSSEAKASETEGAGDSPCKELARLAEARERLLERLAGLAAHAASSIPGADERGARNVLASVSPAGVCEEACGKACGKGETALAAAKAKACDKPCAKGETALAAAKTKACDKPCAKGETALAAATKASFCPKKAEKIALAVRSEKCDKTAAKLLISEIRGLSCEKKAASVVSQIRDAGCEKSAAKVVLTTVSAAAPATKEKAEESEKGEPVSLETKEKACDKGETALAAAEKKACDKPCDKGETVLASAEKKACDKGETALAAATKASFCPKKAEKIALAVRSEKCDKTAAKLLISEVRGLSCEKKAASVVSQIRDAGCEKSAAKIVLTTVSAAAPATKEKAEESEKGEPVSLETKEKACDKGETALASAEKKACDKPCDKDETVLASAEKKACAKGETALASAESSFCPKKAEKIALAVRSEKCGKTAAKLLISEIRGLSCEKKAASVVSQIRDAGCEKSAAKVVLTAASAAAPASETTDEDQKGEPVSLETKEKACLSTLANQAEKLAVSWKKARTEYAALSQDEREAIVSSVIALQKDSEAARLVPETLTALADGVEALAELDAALLGRIEKTPAVRAKLSEEVLESYRRQVRLVRETAAALGEVRSTLKRAEKALASK